MAGLGAMLTPTLMVTAIAIAFIASAETLLSAAAVDRGAKAVGLDFAGVVALARKLVAGAEFQDGDATRLPFPDDSFDAVVCGYGVMHVPDAEAALLGEAILSPALGAWLLIAVAAGLIAVTFGLVKVKSSSVS